MRFIYNPKKAAQAAAYLVRLNDGMMGLFWLLKILYMSDRKALALRGRPITGDLMYSMPHGPVLSRIYDDIKIGELPSPWNEYLSSRDSNSYSLIGNPPTDELSEFEREILGKEHGQFRMLDFGALRDFTHSLPEYEDPQGGSRSIDPAIILRNEGWTDDEIEEAQKSAGEETLLATVTGRA